MSAGNYDFCFPKSFVKRFRYQNALGVAISAVGWTGKMTVKYKDSTGSRFSTEFSTANGKLVLSPSVPHIQVTCSIADAAAMPSEVEHDYDHQRRALGAQSLPIGAVPGAKAERIAQSFGTPCKLPGWALYQHHFAHTCGHGHSISGGAGHG